jgi:hypothetical protein
MVRCEISEPLAIKLHDLSYKLYAINVTAYLKDKKIKIKGKPMNA